MTWAGNDPISALMTSFISYDLFYSTVCVTVNWHERLIGVVMRIRTIKQALLFLAWSTAIPEHAFLPH